MTVWDSLVGQQRVVATLRAAALGTGMTHAWLLTGPPGSGRSNAAVAFAAALQCSSVGSGGCGECEPCRLTLRGAFPDVRVHRPQASQIKVDDVREWVGKAALLPSRGRFQVTVVEDADRLNEHSGNALLKAIEEPTPRTVWILCAPQPDDVLVTIRSRTRQVTLVTPQPDEVAAFLVDRHGVSAERAAHAARASQGHIGRAKALVLDEETRRRRREVVELPPRLTSLGSCMTAAANLVDIAEAEAAAQTEEVHAKEAADLEALYGSDRRSRATRSARAATAELERDHKARVKRKVIDAIDRQLTELLSVYRDVLAVQAGAGHHLVNEEHRPQVEELARRTTPESTLHRIDAVGTARQQMVEFNVPPLLALEAMMVSLMVD